MRTQTKRFAIALFLLLVLSSAVQCGRPAASASGVPRYYGFLDHFPEATVEALDLAYVKAGEVVRVAGEGRFCLFEHADAQVTFPSVPTYENGRLVFGVGIHQEAWNRPGDGVVFALEVVDEAGRTHRLYERHLDPYNRPEDRRWFDETLDLGIFAGQRLQVRFVTEAGGSNQNDWAAWSLPYLVSEEPVDAMSRGLPNILFITLDTVRADHLSSYGYARQTSPTLDRLAQEGVRFAHSYSHSEHTNPSHLTMLTGLYPRSHGIANNHTTVPLEITTIPERLQEVGFHTAGVVSAYHLGPVLNMDQGFTDFFSCERERRRGDITTEIALEWLLEQGQEPFFLWVHYFDPHAPYLPPGPYASLHDATSVFAPYRRPMTELRLPANWVQRYGDWPAAAEDVAEVIAQYDGAITYADAQVARLLAHLEEQGLSDHTIVIVTADHGEGFGEHGVAFDHYGLHEEMVHVPLVIRYPGRLPRALVVKDLVGHVDLGPTLFDLLGLAIPQEMQGLSLVPLMEGRRWSGREGIVSQQHDDLTVAVRSKDWRLILQLRDDDVWPLYSLRMGLEELYDLQADPDALDNLLPEPPSSARRAHRSLSDLLDTWRQDISLTMVEGAPLDEDTEELLRRLGY
jgi:arylsulfatase A-like enzyme